MKKRRPHCSLLPDVKIPMPKFAIIRHYLLEEGMETIEEGFTVTKTKRDDYDGVLISNFRGTELTEAEKTKGGWDSTTEDVLDRARDQCGKDAVVEAIKFLLNVIEQQDGVIQELTKKTKV